MEAIQRILPMITLLFLGSNKHKCARETLYLMWLLHPSVSDKELRDTISQSLLINTSGRSNSFIPLDRHLEHINKALRDDVNAHKNSTHDWTTILQSYARIAPYYGKLRNAVEKGVEYKSSGKHSHRDTSFDVFNMALQLWKDGYVDWTSTSTKQFLCDNVVWDGMVALPKAVTGFNRDVVDKQAGRFAADITHDPELAERNGDDDCDQQTEDNVFVTDFCLENSF